MSYRQDYFLGREEGFSCLWITGMPCSTLSNKCVNTLLINAYIGSSFLNPWQWLFLQHIMDHEAENDQKRCLYFFSPIFFRQRSLIFIHGSAWNFETWEVKLYLAEACLSSAHFGNRPMCWFAPRVHLAVVAQRERLDTLHLGLALSSVRSSVAMWANAAGRPPAWWLQPGVMRCTRVTFSFGWIIGQLYFH